MRDKQQSSQPSRGIIDHYQQSTARSAFFEPGMVRAIHLHQFPEAGPPLTQRMHPRFPGFLGFPYFLYDHQLAHTFYGYLQSMFLRQLFVRQGRPKI